MNSEKNKHLPTEDIMNTEKWEKEMTALVFAAVDGKEIRVSVGGQTLLVEVASTRQSRERGLSDREEIPAQGMLFMYAADHNGKFHRVSMGFDIGIRFYDASGEQVFEDLTPSDIVECPVPYRYVLETAIDLDLEGTLTVHGYTPITARA
jgi:uncharacterized membrane protein (UPF0127 family)